MSHVFISHASVDQVATLRLCELIESRSIKAWVSFRELKGGDHWDEKIDSALNSAAAVVVIVSRNSINSRYVRAEVEGALSAQLTVIPVLLEDVRLPIRWNTLQYIRWNGESTVEIASDIEKALPDTAKSLFQSYLNDKSKRRELRELILSHTEWLPIELGMHLQYLYARNAELTPGKIIDCFSARVDSIGPRAGGYYIGSPYSAPFTNAGQPSKATKQILDRIEHDINWFLQDISDLHHLCPNNFLGKDVFSRPFYKYSRFCVYAVLGRRRHYRKNRANAAREIAIDNLYEKSNRARVSIEILSYDRLLELIDSAPSGNAGWYRKHEREAAETDGRGEQMEGKNKSN